VRKKEDREAGTSRGGDGEREEGEGGRYMKGREES